MMPDLDSLRKRQVHVWFAVPDEIASEALLGQYFDLLDDSERAQAQRFRLPALRHTYVVAHALVRTSLSRYAAVEPATWSFVRNRYGKPEIAGPSAPPLRFNLSHADGLVACGVVVDHDIGVDVEDGQRKVDLLAVAESSFAGPELDELRHLEGSARRERFFGYWTLKEAYVKARGMGLSIPLDQFWFNLDAQGPPRIAFASRLPDRPERWQFARLRPSWRHAASVALRRCDGPDYQILGWKTVPLAAQDEPIADIVIG